MTPTISTSNHPNTHTTPDNNAPSQTNLGSSRANPVAGPTIAALRTAVLAAATTVSTSGFVSGAAPQSPGERGGSQKTATTPLEQVPQAAQPLQQEINKLRQWASNPTANNPQLLLARADAFQSVLTELLKAREDAVGYSKFGAADMKEPAQARIRALDEAMQKDLPELIRKYSSANPPSTPLAELSRRYSSLTGPITPTPAAPTASGATIPPTSSNAAMPTPSSFVAPSGPSTTPAATILPSLDTQLVDSWIKSLEKERDTYPSYLDITSPSYAHRKTWQRLIDEVVAIKGILEGYRAQNQKEWNAAPAGDRDKQAYYEKIKKIDEVFTQELPSYLKRSLTEKRLANSNNSFKDPGDLQTLSLTRGFSDTMFPLTTLTSIHGSVLTPGQRIEIQALPEQQLKIKREDGSDIAGIIIRANGTIERTILAPQVAGKTVAPDFEFVSDDTKTKIYLVAPEGLDKSYNYWLFRDGNPHWMRGQATKDAKNGQIFEGFTVGSKPQAPVLSNKPLSPYTREAFDVGVALHDLPPEKRHKFFTESGFTYIDARKEYQKPRIDGSELLLVYPDKGTVGSYPLPNGSKPNAQQQADDDLKRTKALLDQLSPEQRVVWLNKHGFESRGGFLTRPSPLPNQQLVVDAANFTVRLVENESLAPAAESEARQAQSDVQAKIKALKDSRSRLEYLSGEGFSFDRNCKATKVFPDQSSLVIPNASKASALSQVQIYDSQHEPFKEANRERQDVVDNLKRFSTSTGKETFLKALQFNARGQEYYKPSKDQGYEIVVDRDWNVELKPAAGK